MRTKHAGCRSVEAGRAIFQRASLTIQGTRQSIYQTLLRLHESDSTIINEGLRIREAPAFGKTFEPDPFAIEKRRNSARKRSVDLFEGTLIGGERKVHSSRQALPTPVNRGHNLIEGRSHAFCGGCGR